MILAIDPGTTESGYVLLDPQTMKIESMGVLENRLLRDDMACWLTHYDYEVDVVIEMIASYGMAVGKEVFETCVNIGRFLEIANGNAHRIPRMAVKMHLCHNPRAKDANINQAVRDRYCEITGLPEKGLKGVKAAPGPLYGIKSHIWAALALAVTFNDQGQAA